MRYQSISHDALSQFSSITNHQNKMRTSVLFPYNIDTELANVKLKLVPRSRNHSFHTAFDNSFAETTLLGMTKYTYTFTGRKCCQSSLATVLSLGASLRLPLAFSLSILRGSTLRRPSTVGCVSMQNV